MLSSDIVRAWKNEDYLAALGPEQIAALPQNPAGKIELAEVLAKNKTYITLKPCFSGPVGECTGNCARTPVVPC